VPRFKILPTDQAFSTTEVVAADGAAVLHCVSRIKCGEADIFQDDNYAFSVRLNRNGLWSIFQRETPPDAAEYQEFG